LPQDIQKKLNDALVKTLNNPEVKAKLVAQGMDPKPSTPDEFAKFIVDETARWANILKDTGITAN
jgi:tripartite-type tricarboxylate transporter receptor subunit TctC